MNFRLSFFSLFRTLKPIATRVRTVSFKGLLATRKKKIVIAEDRANVNLTQRRVGMPSICACQNIGTFIREFQFFYESQIYLVNVTFSRAE